MPFLCIAIITVYLLFLPPYSPIDVATAVDAPLMDYVADDSFSLSDEIPGKQCPFPSPRYRLSFRINFLH